MIKKFLSQDFKEKLYSITFARNIYFLSVLFFSSILMKLGYLYSGTKIFMDGFRIINEESYFNSKKTSIESIIEYNLFKYFNRLLGNYVLSNDGNLILKSYQYSKYAKNIRKEFSHYDLMHRASLKYPRKNDYAERQGDLIILKKYNELTEEKGVIYISYTEGLGRFAALYDIVRLADNYQFVFEPSWWGYQNAFFLLYLGINTDIVIECPYEKDYKFIKLLNHNFNPSKLGFGDWVDDEKFNVRKKEKKLYDIVMVGNWGKVKRHEVLFSAVKKMEYKPYIVLIGYPAFKRTKKDIMKEAAKHNVTKFCTVYENISPDQVALILSQAKVNVLLSKGEGANRGIYEGMFCGNVVVVYKENKGVNIKNINENTGYLARDNELPKILETAIKNYEKFNPRKWAQKHTGYKNATEKLNAQLKTISVRKGRPWTQDIVPKKNLPNLVYGNNNDRVNFEDEFKRISNFLF